MNAELTQHRGYETRSRRQQPRQVARWCEKTIKGNFGKLAMPKHQIQFTEFDDKITSMHTRGITMAEFEAHLKEIHGVEANAGLISQVTDAISEEVRAWQAITRGRIDPGGVFVVGKGPYSATLMPVAPNESFNHRKRFLKTPRVSGAPLTNWNVDADSLSGYSRPMRSKSSLPSGTVGVRAGRLFPFVSFLLLFSTLSYGQSWSGVLSRSRAIDWGGSYGAGLPPTFPDGETTQNPWTPPTRTQCGSTLNPVGGGSDDVPQIATAISNCTSRHYVLLASGAFQIKSRLALDGAINVSLRGTSPQSTKLNIGSGGSITIGDASSGGSCSLTAESNYAQGSSALTCTGSTPPIGHPVAIVQCDTGMSGAGCSTGAEADNGGIWVCGEQTICSNQSASGGHQHQQQAVLVTAVSGTCSSSCTVTITPGLYMPNWAFARTPKITWNSTFYTAIGVGFEDLTVDFTAGTSSNNGTFTINNAYASWIKGARFIGPNAGSCCGLLLMSMGNVLFSNNYYFSTNPLTGVGEGLPIQPNQHSATLFQNNITEGGGISSMEQQGNNSGNVYAYNYALNNSTGQVYNGDAEHSASPSFELREGNMYGPSEDDGTWGTHNFDTWFRNYISCYDPPYAGLAAPRGILIDNFARFENVVGNALGSSGNCTTYKGSGSNLNEIGFGAADSLAKSTAMLWGNYSTSLGANQFNSSEIPSSLPSPNTAYSNPVPSNNNLPASFYMDNMGFHPNGGTGLNWWKVCTSWTTFPTSCAGTQTPPMPAIGPDVTGGPYIAGHAYATPAVLAWNNLPIDSTYQNSYTITDSSWSNGTETLTISGLYASAAHIMGGFQLSGINAACLPSSGVSYTGRPDGEILITRSTTTTVSYALASSPSVSCTGTFKFPDVRQFDERVYQTDGGGGTISAPTSLSAVVQ